MVQKLDSLVEIQANNLTAAQWDSLVTTPYWDELTQVKLVYHKPPKIILSQGFDKYLCNNPQNAAIIQQGNDYTIKFQVIENFGNDCLVKNGYVKIRNAAAAVFSKTLFYDAQGNLDDYTFTAANPNLVKPYLYNCYVSYYNLSHELVAETNLNILVEGTYQLPGSDVIVDVGNKDGSIPLPLYVLRDPPGDGSFSRIEKGSKVDKDIKMTIDSKETIHTLINGTIVTAAYGDGWKVDSDSIAMSHGNYHWIISSETMEDIQTGSGPLEVGKNADIIIGAGLAMQYGLAKKIKSDGCSVTDSTIFALGPNGINTTWMYTVGHIHALIAEDKARIYNHERLSVGGVLKSVAYSKAFFQNKIKNWEKILQYHERETLPFYNLCTAAAPENTSPAQKQVYKAWQDGFCKLVRKSETGPFEVKDNLVWNQELVDAYNVGETVMKNVVKEDWNLMAYDWEFKPENLQHRADYIDQQYELLHGIAAENRTFSAGVKYEKAIESAKFSNKAYQGSVFFHQEKYENQVIDIELDLSNAPLGLGAIIGNQFYFHRDEYIETITDIEIHEDYKSVTENINNVYYTLEDNDPTDQFSVTIIQGIEPNQTPYFSLLGGRSSCPDEAGTILQDDPRINILKAGAATKFDMAENVDPEGSAKFLIQIANLNPFHVTRDIAIATVLGKNKYGAKISLGGVPLITNTFYNVSPYEPIVMELNVERGLNEYDYDSLQVVVFPYCYTDPDLTHTLTNGDTITFSVHFANPCSDIVLAEPADNWVIQRRNFTSNVNQEAIKLKAAGFDVTDNSFQRIYFQYRRIGVDNDWKMILDSPNKPNSFVSKDSLAIFVADNVFPNEVPYYWYIWDITDDFERYPNGQYQVRVVAECNINGKIVLSYSNISTGFIDRNQQLTGLPEPADKIWTYGDEISISFIKDIQCNKVDSTNFIVRNLNSLVNGIYTTVPGKIYCHNNKLSFMPNAPMNTFDGDTLQFTVSGTYNVLGELMNDETWSFGVYARDLYMDKTKFDVKLYQGESKTLVSHFFNYKPSGNLTYSILGLTPIGSGNDGTYSDWFTARNAHLITMGAGTSETVYFDLDAANLPVGFYTVTFDVQDSNGPFSMYEKALTFNLEVMAKPSNWTVNPANFEHSMTINANYQFTNPVLPINTDTSDLISVWIGNELRGVAKVEKIGIYTVAPIVVYGNNADAGKKLSFRVWDTSTGTEYDAFPTVARTYTKNASIGMIINPLILSVNQVNDKARYIYLREGWNLFSLNTQNANDSLNKVLLSLKHATNGDVIKTATKAATFNGTSWVTANNLYLTDIYHGYQLKLANADTLRMTGVLPTTLSKDSLFNGWNLIAAPLTSPNNIKTVLDMSKFLSTAQPDTMILKTVAPPNEGYYQNMVAYYITNTNWQYSNTSGMESIRPNYGYWLKVNKNTNLCMSANNCIGTTILRLGSTDFSPSFDPHDTQTWLVNPADYEFNMLITGYIEIDNEVMVHDGIKVAAYIGNECRGVGELVYVPEMGRYLISLFVYANTSPFGANLAREIYVLRLI